ncbi:MAG: pantoate--beta-alanine ligase [Nitrospirae bacterium]|nr:MAG: pantoate--beta-alanine ligase [Nitrospirota bacterium]
MEIIRIPRILQDTCFKQRMHGRSIGFVPTMGALHEGHLSLIKRAASENDITVVSIFVNPMQFGPSEDLASYPRDVENDILKIRELKADILFLPDNSLMYAEGFSTSIQVDGLSERLCGHFRPGHFRGVATVVAKLLNLTSPTRAYFGQKDFQQTVVIKRMVRDLNIGAEIVVCPTIREADGLAMSSRNRYLAAEERTTAATLYKALSRASQQVVAGEPMTRIREQLHAMLSAEPKITAIDYASVFHPETLQELQETGQLKEVLIAVAVRIGKTRLIDNLIVNR